MSATDDPTRRVSAWDVFFADPDGYKINFSNATDLPEETLLSEVAE